MLGEQGRGVDDMDQMARQNPGLAEEADRREPSSPACERKTPCYPGYNGVINRAPHSVMSPS
jgi:hypothetical protein